MSLQAEARSQRAQRSPKKRKSARAEPLSLLLDSQVLRFSEWCRLGGFSARTGRRSIASGDGPVITQLSSKRVGITVAADRAWKASRERA